MSRVKYRYARVSRRMYADDEVASLSKPGPCGLAVWRWLLTCQEATPIPGAIIMSEGQAADINGWTVEGFRKGFAEVSRKPLAKADWKARLVILPNAVEHDPPKNPNVVLSWERVWPELPECELKDELVSILRSWCKGRGKAWLDAFDKGCPKHSAKGYPNPDPDPDPDLHTHTAREMPDEEAPDPDPFDGNPDGPPIAAAIAACRHFADLDTAKLTWEILSARMGTRKGQTATIAECTDAIARAGRDVGADDAAGRPLSAELRARTVVRYASDPHKGGPRKGSPRAAYGAPQRVQGQRRPPGCDL